MNNEYSGIDILFRCVLHQWDIRKQIFHHVGQYNRTNKLCSKTYDQIDNISWIIKNNHYALLEYKLRNSQQCLYIKPSAVMYFMKIKDLHLFKLCFQTYKHYFQSHIHPSIAVAACYYNNLDALKYMLELGYLPDERCLEYACQHNNLDMFNYLINYSKEFEITLPILSNAIDSGNVEMVDVLLKYSKTVFKSIDVNSIVIAACSCQRLEIFKLVISHFQYDISGMSVLMGSCLNSLEIFQYLLDNSDSANTNLAFKSSLALICARDGHRDIIECLFGCDYIPDSLSVSLANTALRFGHIELYHYIQADKKIGPGSLGSLTISDIKDALDDVEMCRYFYQELRVPISGNCLAEACQGVSRYPVFTYLWSCANPVYVEDKIIVNGSDITSRLIKECCKHNNIKVLAHLNALGYIPANNPGSWRTVDGSEASKPIIELLFALSPPTKPFLGSLLNILNAAATLGSLEVFKILYTEKCKLSSDPADHKDLYPAFNRASTHGHLAILAFLYDQGHQPKSNDVLLSNIAPLMNINLVAYLVQKGQKCSSFAINNAAACGNLDFIKFFSKELDQHISSYTLMQSIIHNHFHCFKYILDHHPLPPTETIMIELGKCPNPQLLKYFYTKYSNCNNSNNSNIFCNIVCNNNQQQQQPQSNFSNQQYQCTFDLALENGNLESIMFLYENVDFKFKIKANLFKSLVTKKYSHILEYIKTRVDSSFKKSIVIKKDKDKDTIIFNQYLKHFINGTSGITNNNNNNNLNSNNNNNSSNSNRRSSSLKSSISAIFKSKK
ncbi:hypothetical protein CYY_003389 [Polysphondylium violaceum]|uniref:Ankyrin repeat-containing protein n=1 Tax=Polysphondylium violaceum TaxID=133409 RepID=A0A8J4PZK3_9MYCE|nr:hypothetical protein CYY_003389 [Polysphondylium violaceum]